MEDEARKLRLKNAFPEEIKEIHFQWSCDFEDTLTNDNLFQVPRLAKYCKKFRLVPRKTVKGGMVQCYDLKWEQNDNEVLKFLDISL